MFASVASLAITFGGMSTFGSHHILMNATSTRHMDRARILARAIPLTICTGCTLCSLNLKVSVSSSINKKDALGAFLQQEEHPQFAVARAT